MLRMRQVTPVKLHSRSPDFLGIEGKEDKKSYSAAGMIGEDPFVPHGNAT